MLQVHIYGITQSATAVTLQIINCVCERGYFTIFHFLFLIGTTTKTDSVLPYMTLTGVFGTLTLVLLVAFLAMTVRLCIHHRKQVTGIIVTDCISLSKGMYNIH